MIIATILNYYFFSVPQTRTTTHTGNKHARTYLSEDTCKFGQTVSIALAAHTKNARNRVFDQLDMGWPRRNRGIGETRKEMEPELAVAPQSDHRCANEAESRPIKNKKSRWLLANEITFSQGLL